MDNFGTNQWQFAAGDKQRNYVDLLLKWDVVALGPGNYGPWPDSKEIMKKEVPGQIRILNRFFDKTVEGDLVILRLGTDEVYGVGIVENNLTYWYDDFGDIDGWDLQFVRRVRWLWKYDKKPKKFPIYTLKSGDTQHTLNLKPEMVKWLKQLKIPNSEYERDLAKLPESCFDRKKLPTTDINEISEYLFDKGIASSQVNDLLAEINELIRIAEWYNRSAVPSEHETVAYLVVPLLRVLGWTPQKVAVEWKNIDVAIFSKIPRENENIEMIVEVKKFGESWLKARDQAIGYAKHSERESVCNRIVLTDGIRYGVFIKKDGSYPELPDAFLNLINMRDNYPIQGYKYGSKEAILIMSSDWNYDMIEY